MKKKNIIYLITIIFVFLLISVFLIYKNNKLNKNNNIAIPRVKYTCTNSAINNEDMIYYTKIIIEGTNAGRIVNYYSGIEILYKNDSYYKDAIKELATDSEKKYIDEGNNLIYTYNKSNTDDNNNNIISKTILEMNNKNIKCIKEKINN